MKIQPKVSVANGPAPDQARLLIGGTDKDSWSSELWANMGHYEKDKWGHIIFVRSGKETPLCFSLPRNLQLEELLLDGGKEEVKAKDSDTYLVHLLEITCNHRTKTSSQISCNRVHLHCHSIRAERLGQNRQNNTRSKIQTERI